jgi:hypothetical protein
MHTQHLTREETAGAPGFGWLIALACWPAVAVALTALGIEGDTGLAAMTALTLVLPALGLVLAASPPGSRRVSAAPPVQRAIAVAPRRPESRHAESLLCPHCGHVVEPRLAPRISGLPRRRARLVIRPAHRPVARRYRDPRWSRAPRIVRHLVS